MTKITTTKRKWMKITPGSLYLPFNGSKRIKPKEVIEATEEDLGSFTSHFKPFEGRIRKATPKKEETKQEEGSEEGEAPEKELFQIEELEDGKFNVISSDGNVMNEKKLTKKQAESLKKSLEEETPGQ